MIHITVNVIAGILREASFEVKRIYHVEVSNKNSSLTSCRNCQRGRKPRKVDRE